MTAWHQLSAGRVAERLVTSELGLTTVDSATRLCESGANELEFWAPPSAIRRFFRQFNNVLLYVLLASGVVTALLSHWVDSGVIFAVVVINAIVGYLQEGRAEEALAAIRQMLSPRAIVLRDHMPTDVPAREVVPGDVVVIKAGDRVAADLRLYYVKNFAVDESILSGESMPVEKRTTPVDEDAPLSERYDMAYAGSLATRGQARGYVVATGTAAEIGRISELLQHVESMTTPLLNKITRFGRRLTYIILGASAAIAAFGIIVRDATLAEMLTAGVSIAVAAIPEGLPPVMTIALAIGVQTLARGKAIVRRLPTVETLGEVNVICTDKTGTLTENEMTVRTIKLVAAEEGDVQVTGVGYRPVGSFLHAGRELEAVTGALQDLLQAGLNCNDSVLERSGTQWRVIGDPTEGALITLAVKGGLDPTANKLERIDSIPFESERRYMATLHRDPDGRAVIFAKGAPEVLLDMCNDTDHTDPGIWLEHAKNLARTGLRVLALAKAEPAAPTREITESSVIGKLRLIGLVGVNDPPRREVRTALAQCRTAGVRVKMITGDHAETASAIAREIGLNPTGRVVTGSELEALSPEALQQVAQDVDVFARASPEHKLRLVEALQSRNQVVAMTGDGVNDAPALKRADIGIAMGSKGTDAARQAAGLILADDNFATIVKAIEQGRGIYDNIKKSVVFLLPTSFAEALVISIAILAGFELPMTPAQILWVNMITAVTLGIALAFEAAEGDVMRRIPRDSQTPLLDGFALWRTAFVGLVMLLGVATLFALETAGGMTVAYARTVAVDTLVVFEAVYLLSSRRLQSTIFSGDGLSGNRVVWLSILAVLLSQLAFTYSGPLQNLFESQPISAMSWARISIAGVVLLLLVELEKLIWSRVSHGVSQDRRDG